METLTCTRCGVGIEAEGIRHRRRHFCSDECCDIFEDEFLSRGGPDAEDLAGADTADELFEDDFLDDDADADADDEADTAADADLDDDSF